MLPYVGSCGIANQEEAEAAYNEGRGDKEEDMQGKTGRCISKMGEAPVCTR